MADQFLGANLSPEEASTDRTLGTKNTGDDARQTNTQTTQDLADKIKSLETALGALEKRERALNKRMAEESRKAKDTKDEFQKAVDDVKEKSIGILAVFVAFFTFISIDFQLFRDFPNWFAAAGVVFISAAIMMGFVLLTHYLFSSAGKTTTRDPRPENSSYLPEKPGSDKAAYELSKYRVVCGFAIASLLIGLVCLWISLYTRKDDTGTETVIAPSATIQFSAIQEASTSSSSFTTGTSP